MNKRKLLLTALTAACIAACCFALAACNAGHEHEYTESVFAATCTEQGYVLYTCNCGESFKDGYTDALTHDTETYSAKPATCTENGWNEYQTCKRDGCGYSTYEEIPAGHKVVADEAVPNDCTHAGKTAGSHCDVCGEVFVAQNVIPASHKPVPDAAVPATCTSEGMTEGSHCKECGEVLVSQSVTPVIPHEVNSKNVCKMCRDDLSTAGLVYAENDDGSYRLTGLGAASAASVVYVPAEHNGKPVTVIAKNAFQSAANLTTVYIPDGVTTLEDMAFRSCNKLTHISLPDTVEKVGEPNGFVYSCNKLEYTVYDNGRYLGNSDNPYVVLYKVASVKNITSLDVHEGAKIINYDFSVLGTANYLTNLGSLTLPDSLEYIMDGAFSDSGRLSSLCFGNNLKYIGSCAFGACANVTSLEIPDSVEYIGKSAFSGFRVVTLTIPFIGESRDASVNGHISYIFGGNSYENNNSYCERYIRTLTVTDATAIGASALIRLGNLEALILCDTVTEIGLNAFAGCTKLTVYYTGTSEQWSGITCNAGTVPVLYYREEVPADNVQSFWHYEDALPVRWESV